MPAVPKADLHARILSALGSKVEMSGPEDEVPFTIKVQGIVPLAVWAYTLTSPPGGRAPEESKAQLIVPGQGKGERGDFVGPSGYYKLLIGVPETEDLFVLWDAYLHRNFAFSKNVQVRGELLWAADVEGWSTGTRTLSTGEEKVFVSRADHLYDIIRRRIGA